MSTTQKARLVRGHPTGRPRCPHCGGIPLTSAEESVLVALYTAPAWPTVMQIAKVTNRSHRTVTRALAAHPSLVMAEEATGRDPYTYALTIEGRRAVEHLAGKEEAAA